MTTTEVFLIAMVIIFTVPYLFWRLGRTDYWAPLVVVQIVGGILLGPGVLGAAFPEYYHFVFTPAVVQSLNGIAWWAVMIFVWIAGIELDLGAAWHHRRETSITAGLALGSPLLFGCAAALVMLIGAGWMGPAAQPWQFVLGVGMACAVTALPILILLMEKLEILRQPIGQRILRYASLDDIAIWGVLAHHPHGLDAHRPPGRISGRIRAGGLAVPLADGADSRTGPLVRGPDLAGALRARRRLVRPALHGRRLPGRRGHGSLLVRPEAAGSAAAQRVAGDHAGVLPQHRAAHQLDRGRAGGVPGGRRCCSSRPWSAS